MNYFTFKRKPVKSCRCHKKINLFYLILFYFESEILFYFGIEILFYFVAKILFYLEILILFFFFEIEAVFYFKSETQIYFKTEILFYFAIQILFCFFKIKIGPRGPRYESNLQENSKNYKIKMLFKTEKQDWNSN